MEKYIYFAAMGLELLLSIVLFCNNRSISAKGKRDNVKTNKQLMLSNLKISLPVFISEAEEMFGAGNGIAKLNYVLNKIHIKCLELSLPYDEKEIKTQIEEILETPQKKEVE